MNPALVSVAINIVMFVLNLFVRDTVRRAQLLASFTEWVNTRQSTADQSVELKESHDSQQADLDELQKTLEAERLNETKPTNVKT